MSGQMTFQEIRDFITQTVHAAVQNLQLGQQGPPGLSGPEDLSKPEDSLEIAIIYRLIWNQFNKRERQKFVDMNV